MEYEGGIRGKYSSLSRRKLNERYRRIHAEGNSENWQITLYAASQCDVFINEAEN